MNRINLNFSDIVIELAQSPDGNWIAAQMSHSSFEVKNIWTGKSVMYLATVHSVIICAKFSADSKFLAVGGATGVLEVWDFVHARKQYVLSRHKSERVDSVCFSADGKILASGSGSKVDLWDLKTGKRVRQCKWEPHTSLCVCFSSDGQKVFAAAVDKILVWNIVIDEKAILKLCDKEREKKNRKILIYKIVNFPFDQTFVCEWDGKDVYFWDLETQKPDKITIIDGRFIYYVAFSPNGKLCVFGTDNGISVWNWQNRVEVRTYKNQIHTMSVSFSQNYERIAFGKRDETVTLMNMINVKRICSIYLALADQFPLYVLLNIVNHEFAQEHNNALRDEEDFCHNSKVKCLLRLDRKRKQTV